MKILFSGGGTMGSVSPLIAVYQRIKAQQPDIEFLFIGTKDGPEKQVVAQYGINFDSISSGRWRRYFSWKNFIDPIKVWWGFFQSLRILIKFKPNVVVVAGAYVGVPMAWSAWLMNIPVLIHQQDIVPGLANKLMANIATKITVSFEISLKDFFPNKTVLCGNPVREEFYSCDVSYSRKALGLKEDKPVLLILGGGTGAKKINEAVTESLDRLLKFCQVVHITGRGKQINARAEDYYQYEFLSDKMPNAICGADLVVCRSGLSTLSELIVMGKSTMLVPMPNSHQEFNAKYFQKNNAVVVLPQVALIDLAEASQDLLLSDHKRQNLSRNIAKMMYRDGAEKVAKEILAMAKK